MNARLPRFLASGLFVLMGGLFVAAFLLIRSHYAASLSSVESSFGTILAQQTEILQEQIAQQEAERFSLHKTEQELETDLFIVLPDSVVPACTAGLLDFISGAEADEAFFADFDWEQFTDDEFAICPPLFAVGGDGAMMDIGFQNLSRLLATNKPIRVIVVDTQVYSNTGGQACTSGFLGQVSDMAGFGPGQHGKEQQRKELALLAIAHRGAREMNPSSC